MNVEGPNKSLRPVHLDPVGRGPGATGGKDFQSVLLESLAQVNQLQQEADAGVERLATGQTDNVAEVFSAVRKAEVAFGLLMEIRNKLLDAYQEVQQMRV
jgi:flagellar hook-basal body complex protein FliE